METIEQYLARGGRIEQVPSDKLKKETARKERAGNGLRGRMSREAQTGKRQDPLLARENGGDK